MDLKEFIVETLPELHLRVAVDIAVDRCKPDKAGHRKGIIPVIYLKIRSYYYYYSSSDPMPGWIAGKD